LHPDCTEIGPLQLCLLGAVSTCLPGGEPQAWSPNRTTQLFALLALRQGEPTSRSWATSQLWTDEAGDLPGVTSRLRKELKEKGLEQMMLPTKGPLELKLPEGTTIDCRAAARDVATLKRGVEDYELEAAWNTIRAALSTLSRPFLEDCNETPFLGDHRRQFDELLYQAQLEACNLAIRLDGHERRVEARRDGEAAVRKHGAFEESHLPLIRLLIEDGEFDDAKAACEACEDACGPGSKSISELRAELVRRKSNRGIAPPPLVLSVGDADEKARFVGREKLLDELSDGLALVEGGAFAGRALTGDKGVGKSRLARQFARRAHANGVAVISAAAEQGANRSEDPCHLLIAAIRAWMERVDPLAIQSFSAEALAEIGQFAPDLIAGLRLQRPVDGPGGDRRLRRAIVNILRNIAEIEPTVLLIDDIQDADPESRRCLEELCSAQPRSLMLVVTGPADRIDLPVRKHPVTLLDAGKAAELAESILDDPNAEAVADLIRRGGGNPFLIVHQTELGEIETDFVLPQLKDAGPGGHDVLRLAAVLGSSFETGVLREAAGADAVKRALDAAERARLIEPTSPVGAMEFAHSLTRDSLLNGLTSIERSELSSRLVDALDSEDDRTAGTRLELLKGLASADRHEIAAVAVQAGEHAMDRKNFRVAVEHFLDGLEREGDLDPPVAGSLLMGLSRAYWSLGEFKLARAQFLRAVRLPNIPPDLRAEAALGFGGRLGFGGATTDRQYISVLRSALDHLPEEYGALRLRLKGALAGALTFAAQSPGEHQRMLDLARAALAGAKEIDDVTVAAEVLSDICWTLWNPTDGDRRREVAEMFVDFAEQSRDIGLLIEARIFRIAAALADGKMDLVHQDTDDCVNLAEQAGIPHYEALAALLRAMRALLSGNLNGAEQHSKLALELGGAEQNPVVFELYGAQVLLIRLFEGRVDKIRASAEALAGAFPRMPAWKAGLGLIFAELGRAEDARKQLELVARDDFASIPEDLFWLVTLDHAAKVAARLGDHERCESLYEKLLPFAGEIVVAGAAVAVHGAIDRTLGLLAAACGDHRRAVEHLRDALRINREIGATAINAYVTAELASALAVIDPEEADAVAQRARLSADESGLNLGLRDEAKGYADPAHPPGAIGALKQGSAKRASQILRAQIDGKSDGWMQQWVVGTRAMRRAMPLAFLPEAACGWTGEIELEFDPPIGVRGGERYWTFEIGRDRAHVHAQASPTADVKLSMSPPTFFKLMAGVLNPVEALLEEHVRIDGDPTVAARLVEMFSGPAPDLDGDIAARGWSEGPAISGETAPATRSAS
jgi:tetratricopeptide (TPR) repeat protein